MKKKFINLMKRELQEEKRFLKEILAPLAREIKNDVYEIRPPLMGEGDFEEREAKEDEEFGNRLAVVEKLKERLNEVNEALKRIEEGNFGKCQNCSKEIEVEVLLANPAAKFCKKCLKKKL